MRSALALLPVPALRQLCCATQTSYSNLAGNPCSLTMHLMWDGVNEGRPAHLFSNGWGGGGGPQVEAGPCGRPLLDVTKSSVLKVLVGGGGGGPCLTPSACAHA